MPESALKHVVMWASAVGQRIVTLIDLVTNYVAQKYKSVWNSIFQDGIQRSAENLDPSRVSVSSKVDATKHNTNTLAGILASPQNPSLCAQPQGVSQTQAVLAKAKFADPDIVSWDGQVKDRKPNGLGTCLYKDKTIRKGEFQSGELVKGMSISSFGHILEGIFNKGSLVNGEWVGPGKFVFKGDFEGANLIKGKKTYFTGDVQEGVFKENKVFTGIVKLRTGGFSHYQDGRLENFYVLPAKLNDQGQVQSVEEKNLVNSSIFDWDGEVTDGKPHGPGTCLYKDRSIHKGDFESGQLVKGTLIFADGQIMTGDFNQGALTSGEWIIPGNKAFKGTLVNNKPLNGWISRFNGEIQQVKDGCLVKKES